MRRYHLYHLLSLLLLFWVLTMAVNAQTLDAQPFIERLNALRARANLPLMQQAPTLLQIAQQHSQAMAAAGELSYTDAQGTPIEDQILAAGYRYLRLRAYLMAGTGTNAAGAFEHWQGDAQLVADLHDPQMTQFGFAAVSVGRTTYFTLLLAVPFNADDCAAANTLDAIQQEQAVAILTLLNADRAAAGLGDLQLNAQLTAAALVHSADMARNDFMAHEGSDGSRPADRATRAGYRWQSVGENVLLRGDLDAAAAYDQWWNSPAHHDNMMAPGFTEVGIALRCTADGGKFYYAMLLGTPSPQVDVAVDSQQALNAINAQRLAAGLSTLSTNPTLMSAALQTSEDLAAAGDTNSPIRASAYLDALGYPWRMVNELRLVGSGITGEAAAAAWLADPTYGRDLLSASYTEAAVGVTVDDQHMAYYVLILTQRR